MDAEAFQAVWKGVCRQPKAISPDERTANPWMPLMAITNADWAYRTLSEGGLERSLRHPAYEDAALRRAPSKNRKPTTPIKAFLKHQTTTK